MIKLNCEVFVLTATDKSIDISKPMYSVELIKRKNNNYDLKYGDKFICINIDDNAVCSITNVRGRSKHHKRFDVAIKTITPHVRNLEILRKKIQKQYVDLIPTETDDGFFSEIDSETEHFEPLKDTTFEKIKPTELEEIISTIILAAHYQLENPPWLKILAAPSVGKTKNLLKFNDDRLVHWTGRTTKNAYLSGKPNKETENPYSVLEEAKGKCIIQNDISTFLGSGEENLRHIIGILTEAYGKNKVTIEDPSGRRVIETWFTIIWGMTFQQYSKILSFTSEMGQRFLIYFLPTDWKTYHLDQNDRDKQKHDDRMKLLVSHILTIQERYSELLEYDEEMIKKAKGFSKRVIILRNLAWRKVSMNEIEHYQRLMNVLLNCAVLRAMLWDRKPTIEDVEFYFKLAIPTIYCVDLFKKFFTSNDTSAFNVLNEKRQKHIIENLKELEIYNDQDAMKGEWYDFFEKYILTYGEEINNQ